MPPAGKKKGEKPKAKGDASDMTTTDGCDRVLPPVSVRIVRHTESELSSTEMEDEVKRFKVGSPKAKRAADAAPAVVSAAGDAMEVSDVASGASLKRMRGRKRPQPVMDTGVVGQMKAVSAALLGLVMADGVGSELARTVMEHSSKYELLLFGLVAENERLKGRLEVYEGKMGGVQPAAFRASMPPPAPVINRRGGVAAVDAPVAAVPKPVETWSVVVKGKKGVSSKEIVEKVQKEVGPTLGVRVHTLRPMRDGGAVIRTPSVAEREKVAKNAKFGEVGLEVSVRDKLGPKIVVQRVHPEITPDEFMTELYEMNLKQKMSEEVFKRSVRLVTGPWKASGGPVNVVLEGNAGTLQHMLEVGRCYIKWFSFTVRQHDAVPSCFRCLGFDHMVRDCRMDTDVCRLCGTAGHLASRCQNEVRCRNCAFKGLPAGHLMMSAACPVYSAIVAKANARH